MIIGLAGTGVGYAYWSDTLTIEGTVSTGTWDVGGSYGFWKNWDKHNTYTRSDIENWLGIIDGDSFWLVPDMNGNGYDIDIYDMKAILQGAQGGTMEEKFLGHYLATRLNTEAEPPRLDPSNPHNISEVDPDNYLDLVSPSGATLSEIVTAIESKYPDAVWPTDAQYGIMKDICDKLNKLEI